MFQKKTEKGKSLGDVLIKIFRCRIIILSLSCLPSLDVATLSRFSTDLRVHIYKSVKYDVTYIITICLIYRHLSSHSCNTRTK